MATRIGCSRFEYHMTVRMEQIGNAPASAHPNMKRTTARPAKFWVAALHNIKIAQDKILAASNLATGRRWIKMAVGHSKMRNPK